MATPPTEVPIQASETASDGTDRAPPSSAAIGFKPTAAIQSAPNEVASSATDTVATIQEDRVSRLGASKPDPGRLVGRGVACVTRTYTARGSQWYHGGAVGGCKMRWLILAAAAMLAASGGARCRFLHRGRSSRRPASGGIERGAEGAER